MMLRYYFYGPGAEHHRAGRDSIAARTFNCFFKAIKALAPFLSSLNY